MARPGTIQLTTSITIPPHWTAVIDRHRRNVAGRTGNMPTQNDVFREAVFAFLTAAGLDMTPPGEQL
jgi:hypothetical protein